MVNGTWHITKTPRHLQFAQPSSRPQKSHMKRKLADKTKIFQVFQLLVHCVWIPHERSLLPQITTLIRRGKHNHPGFGTFSRGLWWYTCRSGYHRYKLAGLTTKPYQSTQTNHANHESSSTPLIAEFAKFYTIYERKKLPVTKSFSKHWDHRLNQHF